MPRPSDLKAKLYTPITEKSRFVTVSFLKVSLTVIAFFIFASLGFRVIWIDDDFRYHNHEPLEWGGFEEEMLKNFSQKVGRKVTRPELVENILSTGSPHLWRSVWLEVWREAHLNAAAVISASVRKNSPCLTKLGIMTSDPSMHSIEGRKWPELFESIRIKGELAHRPNFASYSDTLGKEKVRCMRMLTFHKKNKPSGCELAPEIENFPFTTWNKSDTSTWADMIIAQLFGSDALLLNLFPFTGNSVKDEPRIGNLLDQSFQALSWVSNNFHPQYNCGGIGIPWAEDASEKVHIQKGKSIMELEVSTAKAWKFMLHYGVPACTEIRGVNVVFGNSAWIFSEDEIFRMLKAGMLLDGPAAKILIERGFGKYLGIEYKTTLEREESKYSLEVVIDKESGVREGFNLSVNLMDKIFVFQPSGNASCWTDILTSEKEKIGPGVILNENQLGGRTAVFAVEDPSGLSLNFQRQTILHNIIRYLYRNDVPFPLVSGGPYLIPVFFCDGEESMFVVFNGSPDPAAPLIEVSGSRRFLDETTILNPLAEPAAGVLEKKKATGATLWKSSSQLPYMGFLVTKILKNKKSVLTH